jgi:hypothetical protein
MVLPKSGPEGDKDRTIDEVIFDTLSKNPSKDELYAAAIVLNRVLGSETTKALLQEKGFNDLAEDVDKLPSRFDQDEDGEVW